jgi:hypothetical protein
MCFDLFDAVWLIACVFFLPETWGIKKFKGEQLHLSHVHASACIFAASEEGIDEALSFIHVQLRKGGVGVNRYQQCHASIYICMDIKENVEDF